MRVTLSILSADGRHKAVVTSCDNGAVVDFYRRNVRRWTHINQVLMTVPYHVALDQAHTLVNA